MRAPITSLHYKLPSTIEAIQQNWLDCMKSSTITSGLLAVVSALLLILFKAVPTVASRDTNTTSQNSNALEILSYASLFLNISCGVSSVLLLDQLGEVPYRSARDPHPRSAGRTSLNAHQLLKEYKVGRVWSVVVWHWLFCLFAGVACLLAELLVYIWTTESPAVKIVISCLCVFTVAPVVLFMFSSLLEVKQGDDCTSDIESQRTSTPLSPLPEGGIHSKRPVHHKVSIGSVSFKTPRTSFIDTNVSGGSPSLEGHFRVDSPTHSPRVPTSHSR